MSFGSVVFTNRGRNLQAKAQAGAQLNFTRIALGNGQLAGQDISELTNLINWVKDIPITILKSLGGGYASIGGQITNQGLVTGFYWREVGLFATDPDLGEILYCYGNAGALAEYIPSGDSGQILERYFAIEAIIGNASNVSATINESLIYVTYPEFNSLSVIVQNNAQSLVEHLADLAPHGRFDYNSDMVYTNGKLTSVDDKIDGILRQRTALTYTGDDLTSVNVKLYATDGTTVTAEYTDSLTYTAGQLSSVQRTVV